MSQKRYRAVTERIVGCLSTYYFPPKDQPACESKEQAIQAGIEGRLKCSATFSRWTDIRVVEEDGNAQV